MTLDELKAAVANGEVDTVLLAMCDMQGRLQGKRLTARFFLDDVVEAGAAEGCNYLLAVDVEMNTVEGYPLTSWESGYGDFRMVPDLATLAPLPWLPRTVICMSDVHDQDDTPIAPSPRQILKRQLDRLAERGWGCNAATELEFMVFRTPYEDAWRSGYRDLEPANLYNVDYSLIGTSRVEPLISRIRREMEGAGLYVETSKGECNLGQHEVNFRYRDALTTCDQHAIYKTGAKEIAAQDGMSLTFMAKFDEKEGSSCHIHCSLYDLETGKPVFGDERETFERFVAGQIAAMRDFSLLYAPNINSYKRFQSASFAPTAVAWGEDNRTCSLRSVGHGPSLRIENRLPGADVNPYLALAAMIAAGLAGIEQEMELEPPVDGNAYAAGKPEVAKTLRHAAELWEGSAIARETLGEEVVTHYANMARVELAAFDAAVTDWERFRGFERL